MIEISPWLDNYPIRRQLWASSARTPGSELKLIPTSRNLTVQWRDRSTNAIVLSSSELSSTALIRVLDVQRGLVEINVAGDVAWAALKRDVSYTCEILAYSVLRDTFEFTTTLPEPHTDNLNGIQLYTSPSQVLDILGLIPGADVQTAVDLASLSWTKNTEGYWVAIAPASQPIYGLWVGGLHAIALDSYEELALGPERCWTRVDTLDGNHSLIYKGPENLASLANPITIETAFNAIVLRFLVQASAEVEAITHQFFYRSRVFRETHDGLSDQRQLTARRYPVALDQYFRLDCYSYSRDISRRYTESSVDKGRSNQNTTLHVDGPTGLITLNDSIWDWGSSDAIGYETSAGAGVFGSFPKGQKNIEITYTGGPSTPPVNVAIAAAKLAAINLLRYYERTMAQGLAGLSIGCGNINFADGEKYAAAWAKEAAQLLENYTSLEFSLI